MRKLTKNEKKSIHQAADLIFKIIECYKVKAAENDVNAYASKIAWLHEYAKAMKEMADEDKIKFGKTRRGIIAWTTRNGIFINENFADGNLKYFMDLSKGDFDLGDCEKGRFPHIWKLIATFFHEYHHYKYHAGILKPIFTKGVINILWVPVYGIWRSIGGRKFKSIWLHETTAYTNTVLLLNVLRDLLKFVKDNNKDCLPCIDHHIRNILRVRRDQLPVD